MKTEKKKLLPNSSCMALYRILFVDDDNDDYVLFSDIVKELNPDANVIYVQDPCDIDKFLTPPLPEIIFLDFNMPKVDGIECLKKIRANSVFNKIPIVVYSVYYDRVAEAYKYGANYFIVKQLSINKVKSSVGAMLNRNWEDEETFKSFDVYFRDEEKI